MAQGTWLVEAGEVFRHEEDPRVAKSHENAFLREVCMNTVCVLSDGAMNTYSETMNIW
jgi:hypothetical protein